MRGDPTEWYLYIRQNMCGGIFDIISELSSRKKILWDDHLCSWIFFLEWKWRFLLRRDNARLPTEWNLYIRQNICGRQFPANRLTLVFCVHFWEKLWDDHLCSSILFWEIWMKASKGFPFLLICIFCKHLPWCLLKLEW